MVVTEQSVMEKSKTLKVLELARSRSNSDPECFAEFVNTHAKTTVILEMLEEVKKDVIPSENANVRHLHTQLLSLPFLPKSGRLLKAESSTSSLET